ncbi:sugar-binding domain-containing protein [Nonomuraea gerenzanensis]|uniref:sugar-binding domain-containing protein n=1 Tax=Nonomuraea gerenzanensis TaxID=93944 RepID=UPI001CD9B1E1|nr:sugar-binding domain-containing protein [Nonomuraea gerenzanensis]UBU18960.1 hypothetical protein LCN96_31305 [Nonomuraea gerenzanensis]
MAPGGSSASKRATFRAVGRRIGIARGLRKLAAIRAAGEGGRVNVLITDLRVARRLCS